MDSIYDYLDMLEDILESGKAVPFSNKVSIEKGRIFDVLGDIRLNLPNEIRQAQRIIEDHDKIIADARQKAGAILKEAESTAQMMTSSHEIYKMAVAAAEEKTEDAKKAARDMRLNAMDYADEIIGKTESMVRDAQINLDQQHRILDEYFAQTVDVLYANRQELRGNQ